MARIGLWGGSFNPPTKAHVAMAQFAINTLSLDELWWIVAPQNPAKDLKTLAPFADRLAMVRLAIQNNPIMKASDLEDRLGSSWTTNTLRHIRQNHPDDHLFFLMGGDNWSTLHTWGDDYADLLTYASLAIFKRPGYDVSDQVMAAQEFKDQQARNPSQLATSGSWCVLENDEIDMAATQVRNTLLQGGIPTQLDRAVLDYILDHNLYR